MAPPDNEHRIVRLETDVGEVKKDVGELKEAAVEHRTRLQNGTRVFEGWDRRIAEVEERTAPRPPSVIKIVGLTLALFLAAAGALWALAHMLRDRPTTDQLENVLDKHAEHHEAVGHTAVREDVRAIQKEQTTQGNTLDGVVEEQKAHSDKLDTLLERVPAPKGRPGR